MKRTTKIIISLSGVIIITLMLLGLTYGYFITKINGNSSSKSIEVTSGLSQIKFTDLSETSTSDIIVPGFETIKLFTVENVGNIEAKYSIYLVDVINEFTRTEDIIYTLYRKDGNNTIDVNDMSDCTVISNGTFPTTVSVIKADESISVPNNFYTYALKIEYVNSYENQNVDQGKTFSAKVNIRATSNILNPYQEGTLAYSIYDNASDITEEQNMLGYAKYVESAQLGIEKNTSNPKNSGSLINESVLSNVIDEYGTSYYYRGNVINNYVNFAGMCWRIVRIVGNGSVKLILEDQDQLCDSKDDSGNFNMNGDWNIPLSNSENAAKLGNFGYTNIDDYFFIFNYLNLDDAAENYEQSFANALMNFQNGKLNNNINDLMINGWCIADNGYESPDVDINVDEPLSKELAYLYKESWAEVYYDSYVRLLGDDINLTLDCNGTKLEKWGDNSDMYVGSLTVDEVLYAGSIISSNPSNVFYLVNEYQNINKLWWWTLSPYYYEGTFDNIFNVGFNGNIVEDYAMMHNSFRPAINLRNGIKVIKGNGTKENPYVIG